MTFCVGIRVDEGLVALADTRITSGDRTSSKSKLSLLDYDDGPIVVMTSGLRSVRDKTVVRLEDQLEAAAPRRLHEVATLFGAELRQVRAEDETSLTDAGLTFNLNAIIAGRLPDDTEPTMFHVYPEGNWVETTPDTPSLMIGRTTYGAPVLDRLLRPDSPLSEAVGLAYLAFDATRERATDVDYPIDMVVLPASGDEIRSARFERTDLDGVSDWWHAQLASALNALPVEWADQLLVAPDVRE